MTGKKAVDDASDTWCDHDDECHGDPYSRDLMEDETFEDGYVMSCCKRRPYEGGCVVSRHQEMAEPAKRARSVR